MHDALARIKPIAFNLAKATQIYLVVPARIRLTALNGARSFANRLKLETATAK